MPNPAPFPSTTYERRCGCGDLYITLGEKAKKLSYVSIDMGKAGGCATLMHSSQFCISGALTLC